MLVNKKALVLREVLEKRNDILGNLYVTKEKVVATDSKMVLELKNPDQKLTKDFPQLSNLNSTEKPCLLSPQTLAKIEKNLPKKTSLPIIENFIIGENEKDINIFTTDLENSVIISQKRVEGDYPEIEKYYPQSEPILKIILNVNLLKKLTKVIEKLSNVEHLGIEFSFFSSHSPVVINYASNETKIKGMLLPMKK